MCGTIDVAKMAQEAGAKRLVLTHQHPKLDQSGQMERAIRDISRHYDGQIVWGEDLLDVEL
jgi:ribonuclease Z